MELIDRSKVVTMFERAMSMVDQRLCNHGTNVSMVFQDMVRAEGRADQQMLQELTIFALLHDIGVCSLRDVDELIRNETRKEAWEHAIRSYLFLKVYFPDNKLVRCVLYHHVKCMEHWRESDEVLHYAQMLHLADRVCVMHDMEKKTKQEVQEYLDRNANTDFSPVSIEIFRKADKMFDTWNALSTDQPLQRVIAELEFTRQQADDFVNLLANVIAFRSHNTALHTKEVMEIALEIARALGLSEEMQRKVHLGGLLHDLGKIGIPIDILEKPGRLTPEEMAVMRRHVELGEQILQGCVDEEVAQIALRHHEKINGTGYPYGLSGKDLTVPQRLLAVADVISALCMVRSYKRAFSKERCIKIIREMAQAGELDADIVQLTAGHFDEIVGTAIRRCQPFRMQYTELQRQCRKMEAFYSNR